MKKTKKALTIILSLSMLIGSSITSFAGNWQQNETGKWWQNDDGSYPANTWQWLDENGDGVAECYYFDGNGYMLANTTTPDGYQVNGDGAWVVNGAVQTQGTSIQNTSGVNHNAGYDPAHPLAGKIDEWNLRITATKYDDYIVNNNVQAMLTGQMDQYFLAPVGEYVDTVGNHIYTTQDDYNKAKITEQALYNWFCDWLNGMDFENMSEMDKAKEIQKVLSTCSYDTSTVNYESGYRYDYSVLINKTGQCSEFAMTACSLARALGLKCAISGYGNHSVYYIQVDGQTYFGQNQVLTLDFPSNDYVYFQ